MPRTARSAVGGMVYHVLNRGNGRMRIFRKPADYAAFESLLLQGKQRASMELFAYCLMPNHWHLVLRPKRGTDLAAYLSWITNTHVKQYRAHYPDTSGHLYQGRYKSFPVQDDGHLLTVLRYVEANPIRGEKKLAERAERWEWSSLGCSEQIREEMIDAWPVDPPGNWRSLVNAPMKERELAEVLMSVKRDRPFGEENWARATAKRMGLEYTFNQRGRPRKVKEEKA